MAKEIDTMSFEEAMGELEKIVRQLEGGGGDLKTSIDAYARGIELKKYCLARLQDAQSRIEKITVSENGEIRTEAFQSSE
jgi:exodeoxyribonuclease VII small subunit